MPVQREKLFAAAGFMPQNHDRTIVQGSRIIRHNVDHALQRRPDASPRLDKKIHPKMNGARFILGWIFLPPPRQKDPSQDEPCAVPLSDCRSPRTVAMYKATAAHHSARHRRLPLSALLLRIFFP